MTTERGLRSAPLTILPIDAVPVKLVDDARFGRRVLRFRFRADLGLIRHDGGLIRRLLSLWLLGRLWWFAGRQAEASRRAGMGGGGHERDRCNEHKFAHLNPLWFVMARSGGCCPTKPAFLHFCQMSLARPVVNQADDDIPHDRTPLSIKPIGPDLRFRPISRSRETGFVSTPKWFRSAPGLTQCRRSGLFSGF
jgi:hypothetical protein